MSDSPLFASARVITKPLPKPVCVVGLPRSGSSFLSDVLSQTRDYFVFDDLYLRRKAHGLGLTGPLDDDQLAVLVKFLGWQVRARIRFGSFQSTATKLAWGDVDEMDRALIKTFVGRGIRWDELLEEWLGRLALHHDATRWGFKAPQDFMHMQDYSARFPGMKYIYLHRDPRSVLASTKFVTRGDGDRWHYHPIVYAKYWAMADQEVEASMSRMPGQILSVGFEELVSDPQATAERLARFLDTEVRQVCRTGKNSSFPNAGKRRDLTPTEHNLCERIAGAAMQRRGYAPSGAKMRLRDLPDLALTTGRFVTSQLWRLVKSPSARHSVRNYLSRLRRSPPK